MASGGQPYTTTLPSDARTLDIRIGTLQHSPHSFHLALREVAEFLAGQRLEVDVETVSLAQHFPRLFLHSRTLCRPDRLV